MRYLPYAIWLVITLLCAVGTFWLYHAGVVASLWKVDEHYVLTTMYAWFVVAILWTGYTAWKIPVDGPKVSKRRLAFTSYSAQTMLNIGLFGTTLGFIAMLTAAFVGKDYSNTSVLQGVLPLIGTYWAMALYSTASAIGLGIVLMTQSFMLRYVTEVIEQKDEERMYDEMEKSMQQNFGIGTKARLDD